MDGWFREHDQDRLPPHHGDIGEVRRGVRYSLAVSHKLMRPTIEGHDTANYKGAQLRWFPTSELVGLGRFRVFLSIALWTCIVLLVGWPWARGVTSWVWLHGCWIVIRHQAPAAGGITDM